MGLEGKVAAVESVGGAGDLDIGRASFNGGNGDLPPVASAGRRYCDRAASCLVFV